MGRNRSLRPDAAGERETGAEALGFSSRLDGAGPDERRGRVDLR